MTTVALAVLAGAGYLVGPGHHASSAAARRSVAARDLSAAPAAKILSLTPKDYLALSNLREGRPTMLKALGEMTYAPIPSIDGRYLLTPYGQLISLTGPASLTVAHSKVTFNGYQESVPYAPFADRDLYAVVLGSSSGFGSTENPIELQAVTTGRTVNLGTGDNVTGDPARPGVFTSVAAKIRPTASASQVFPDGRVELRDAGRGRVTLATIAQLDRDVHLPAGSQAALFPFASPAGDKVAVAVQPTSAPSRAGVVVMTRTGHVIRTFTGLPGLIVPVWSQSSKAIAFATSGPRPGLYIWGGGRRTETVPLPAGQYGSCVWSPDGAWVLCPAQGPSASGRTWILSSADGSTTVHTAGPGVPIAWLGGN